MDLYGDLDISLPYPQGVVVEMAPLEQIIYFAWFSLPNPNPSQGPVSFALIFKNLNFVTFQFSDFIDI